MPIDRLTIEASGGDRTDFNFEDFASFTLRTSIVEPAEVSLELGDQTGFERLRDFVQLGSQFQVFLGDRPRLRGRVEAVDAPHDAQQSSVQRLAIRTRLTDAVVSSAPQGIRLKDASIREFILACYAGVDLTEADFDFRGDVSRDLMTGKGSRGQRAPKALDALKAEQAKVAPPEAVFSAVDRHLRRHGLLHWDGPDGKIVVAAPDDQQDPIYFVQLYRSPDLAQLNNALSINRSFDVSQSATHLGVFGTSGKADFSKAKVGSVVFNPTLIAAGFNRRVVVQDEGVRNNALAERRANYEFAQRNRSLERLTIRVDGLSYRNGSELIPWAPDTVVDVVSEDHGGALGAYYVETVEMSRTPQAGDVTTLTAVAQGVWVL
jgi:hypothetical protein